MLNKRSVFIVAFARGGSNIVLNMLRSHPDICSPVGETQEVFHGKGNAGKIDQARRRLKYLPIALAENRNVFSMSQWNLRKPFKSSSKKKIDEILFNDRFKGIVSKDSESFYTNEELKNCRLLCKNLNGLIFTTRNFLDMYPDATFIGIVRDLRAVCEGHIRRHLYSLEEISHHCSNAIKQMLIDEKEIERFHLFRYEDIVKDPQKALSDIYKACDLPLETVKEIRMETKKVVGHNNSPDGKSLVWYPLDQFHKHILPDANENQIAKLTDDQRVYIENVCREEMEHFGYL